MRAEGPATLPAVRELLAGIVDYAGLFPPAALEMRAAAERYAAARASLDAWALGRFVVPAGRIEELAATAAALGDGADPPWRLSVLVGPDVPADLARIRALGEQPARDGVTLVAEAVELRAAGVDEIAPLLRDIPRSLTTYVELPLEGDLDALVGAVREAGGRAKVRTGGVAPEAFPDPDALLAFLRACTDADLPFKATAGLHHPVAGRYHLTYEAGSAAAPMYGYLNLLFATALLRRGAPGSDSGAALREADPSAFRLDANAVAWRHHRLASEEIGELRARGMVGFGSCSFREPLDELLTAVRLGASAPVSDDAGR